MNVLKIDDTPSTNTWLAEHAASLEWPAMVVAHTQSAGRGQRGNSWESEPGKNITASVVFRPEGIAPSGQFEISEAIALAVSDTLLAFGVNAQVKWPNDIYVGDRKIAGILIENVITGDGIERVIAGIGLNVNQEVFVSDAPNPVSLKQVTGRHIDLEKCLRVLELALDMRTGLIDGSGFLHRRYMERLWRADDFYPFRDVRTSQHFMGMIHGIAPDGMLTLLTDDMERRQYRFKEVEFIIDTDPKPLTK